MSAYAHGNDLHFGNFSLPGSTVKQMLENIELIVFPVVNPDGKHYSQTIDRYWRKNRGPTSDPAQIGADLNRNYDWLWDVGTHFRTDGVGITVGSDDPSIELYRGIAPFSEPETRNVKHVLDTNPQIRFFVDVHCYHGYIMYPWADDDAQAARP